MEFVNFLENMDDSDSITRNLLTEIIYDFPSIKVAYHDSSWTQSFKAMGIDSMKEYIRNTTIQWRSRTIRNLDIEFINDQCDDHINQRELNDESTVVFTEPFCYIYSIDCRDMEVDYKSIKLRLESWLKHFDSRKDHFTDDISHKRAKVIIVQLVPHDLESSISKRVYKRLIRHFKGYRVVQYCEPIELENIDCQLSYRPGQCSETKYSMKYFEKNFIFALCEGFAQRCRYLEDLILKNGSERSIRKLLLLERLASLWSQFYQFEDALRIYETLEVYFRELISAQILCVNTESLIALRNDLKKTRNVSLIKFKSPVHEKCLFKVGSFNYFEDAKQAKEHEQLIIEFTNILTQSKSCISFDNIYCQDISRFNYEKYLFSKILGLKLTLLNNTSLNYEVDPVPLFLYCRKAIENLHNSLCFEEERKAQLEEKKNVTQYYLLTKTQRDTTYTSDDRLWYFVALVEVSNMIIKYSSISVKNKNFITLFLKPIRNFLLGAVSLKTSRIEQDTFSYLLKVTPSSSIIELDVSIDELLLMIFKIESYVNMSSRLFYYLASVLNRFDSLPNSIDNSDCFEHFDKLLIILSKRHFVEDIESFLGFICNPTFWDELSIEKRKIAYDIFTKLLASNFLIEAPTLLCLSDGIIDCYGHKASTFTFSFRCNLPWKLNLPTSTITLITRQCDALQNYYIQIKDLDSHSQIYAVELNSSFSCNNGLELVGWRLNMNGFKIRSEKSGGVSINMNLPMIQNDDINITEQDIFETSKSFELKLPMSYFAISLSHSVNLLLKKGSAVLTLQSTAAAAIKASFYSKTGDLLCIENKISLENYIDTGSIVLCCEFNKYQSFPVQAQLLFEYYSPYLKSLVLKKTYPLSLKCLIPLEYTLRKITMQGKYILQLGLRIISTMKIEHAKVVRISIQTTVGQTLKQTRVSLPNDEELDIITKNSYYFFVFLLEENETVINNSSLIFEVLLNCNNDRDVQVHFTEKSYKI